MKKSLILSAIVLAIAATILFVELSYSVKSLEFAGGGVGQVETSGMGISLNVCNPSLVPVSIDSITANLTGSSGDYGLLEIAGKSVPPLSQGTLQGSMDFTDLNSMKTFVDWVLNNQTNADFNSTLLVKAKVLGIIPYSYEKNYDLVTFSNLVFGKGEWTCQSEQNYTGNIKQQLILAQARMSTTDLLYSDTMGIYNSTKSVNSTENNQTMQGH
ncbi:MAG: hypothetical protein ACREBB_06055 [Nitrosotalea sp.]